MCATLAAVAWLVITPAVAWYLGYLDDRARLRLPTSSSDVWADVTALILILPMLSLGALLLRGPSRTRFLASAMGSLPVTASGVWIIGNAPTLRDLGIGLALLAVLAGVASLIGRAVLEPEEDILSMPPPTHQG
jgi:energy-converting hydrogenase Eha subunit A